MTGNIRKYDSDSEDHTEVPETVSFSKHFCFSGSKHSSDEEISLQWQWNQVEHWQQNLTNPTSDSELRFSGKSETTWRHVFSGLPRTNKKSFHSLRTTHQLKLSAKDIISQLQKGKTSNAFIFWVVATITSEALVPIRQHQTTILQKLWTRINTKLASVSLTKSWHNTNFKGN